jgi:hypothetical protein
MIAAHALGNYVSPSLIDRLERSRCALQWVGLMV